uniref:ML domain-containing protein n=1 Tax=Syphacia muris TaxID=451379 RepID=A0A0N5A815_9BILA
MIVTASKVLNKDDIEMYPIDFKAPMTIELTAVNNGDVYQDNKVDVHLSQYTTGWLASKCEWKEVPTFGLLSNIDGCSYAKNCPLEKGNLDLRLPLDMTSFSTIINALLGDHPYQLSIHMKNYNPGVEKHEEIACVTAQMKIKS